MKKIKKNSDNKKMKESWNQSDVIDEKVKEVKIIITIEGKKRINKNYNGNLISINY